ncbi:MAG: ester cyclase [Acidobacteria bacterium]|nr:ester cyclase [Acidobacteriota bacterium]MBI3424754.1 ester cyclase [Acidobacteriota bacterium]
MKTSHETIARRYRAEVCHGKLAVADEIFDPAVQAHVSDSLTPPVAPGVAAIKAVVTMYSAAFPDTQYTIEDIVVGETKAAVRWSARGTHTGALGELAPTGKQVSVTGMDVYHFRDGKIVDVWVSWDALGCLKQLGVA